MRYGDYPDLSRVKKVLVIKLRHLGDTLLSSPLFSVLKERLNASVDACVFSDSFGLLEGHGGIDGFLLCDRKKRNLGQFWQARAKHYDLVINLTEGDSGAMLALASGAAIRVGMDPEGKGLPYKKKFFTHLVKNCPMPRHNVERNLDALRRIGIFPEEHEKKLFLAVQETELPFDDYILVHAVSRWRFKCYPHMGELLRLLTQKGHKIVFTGGAADYEQEIIQNLARKLPDGSYANLAGAISLKEMGYVMQQARGVITIDSVPLHMASALKKRGVVLFGPTSEQNWGPWQNLGMQVVASDICCRPCGQDGCGGSKFCDCLHGIAPESALQVFENQINRK